MGDSNGGQTTVMRLSGQAKSSQEKIQSRQHLHVSHISKAHKLPLYSCFFSQQK